ncbi:MAG: lipoate protein ligase C-terminal domain-containing protein [Candidatus Bathyarchaeia archaeon]
MRAELKAKGGKLLKVECSVENDVVKDVKFTGDFFLTPEESIFRLEELLKETPAIEEEITRKVETFFRTERVTLIGLSPTHFVEAIFSALKTKL